MFNKATPKVVWTSEVALVNWEQEGQVGSYYFNLGEGDGQPGLQEICGNKANIPGQYRVGSET